MIERGRRKENREKDKGGRQREPKGRAEKRKRKRKRKREGEREGKGGLPADWLAMGQHSSQGAARWSGGRRREEGEGSIGCMVVVSGGEWKW